MGIKKKFIPGGTCCAIPGTCIITEGDLTGAACSGSWTRSSTQHISTSASGLWYDNVNATATTDSSWKILLNINLDITTTTMGTPPNEYEAKVGTFTYRAIGGFLDCDNYVFVEIYHKATGIYDAAAGNEFQIRLGKRVAGVETLYTEIPDSVSDTSGDNAELLSDYGAEICWDDANSSLTAETYIPLIGGTVSGGISTNQVSILGQYFGFYFSKTSQINEIRGTILAVKVEDGCQWCHRSCCFDEAPTTLVFEISGGTGTIEWDPGVNCTYVRSNCSDITGTFYFTRRAADGDAACYWLGDEATWETKEWGVADHDCSGVFKSATWNTYNAENYPFGIGLSSDYSTHAIGVTLEVMLPQFSFGLPVRLCSLSGWSSSYAGTRCETWLSTWQTLTYNGLVELCDECDWSAATIRVKISP